MDLTTLENVPVTALVAAFNSAFEDYSIPMQQTKETLLKKMKVEDIDLNFSVGAMEDDLLAGFILFGIDDDVNGVKCAWDGGTGVIPAFRGRRLTQRMFDFVLPVLKSNGVEKILLEVLVDNVSAYNIYASLGFKPIRKLHAYKGIVNSQKHPAYTVERLNKDDTSVLLMHADFLPSWQQMNKRIENRGEVVTTLGVRNGNRIVGYVSFDNNARRVLQFAVDKDCRRQGIATALFQAMSKEKTAPISVINVDDRSENTNAFLEAIGLDFFISQYEMEMTI